MMPFANAGVAPNTSAAPSVATFPTISLRSTLLIAQTPDAGPVRTPAGLIAGPVPTKPVTRGSEAPRIRSGRYIAEEVRGWAAPLDENDIDGRFQ